MVNTTRSRSLAPAPRVSRRRRAAELNISHVLLEPSSILRHDLQVPKGKARDGRAGRAALGSPMSFGAGSRETILGTWDNELKKYKVNIKYGHRVSGITGSKGNFTITTSNKQTITAEAIILSIGLQGNIASSAYPAKTWKACSTSLDDPDVLRRNHRRGGRRRCGHRKRDRALRNKTA